VWVWQVRGPRPGADGVDLQRSVCVVTGASSGIGIETARELARRGATVVLAVRSVSKAEPVRAELAASFPGSEVIVMELDLGSFASVRAFAKALEFRFGRCDVLVHNAGQIANKFSLTADGHEQMLQVHCLSVFLLSMLLLPQLRVSSLEGGARVVIVSSSSMHLACRRGGFRVPDPEFRQPGAFSMVHAYPHSKLCTELLKVELARRLALCGVNVSCNSLSPGTVMTSIARELPWLMRTLQPLVLFSVNKTPRAGAYTSVWAVTSRQLIGRSGLYLEHCRAHAPHARACDPAHARQVWALCEQATGLDASELLPAEVGDSPRAGARLAPATRGDDDLDVPAIHSGSVGGKDDRCRRRASVSAE
jgi:NAD(P)-dependent dehydrogenase (short-subunit alcohol dehydrogenase family)